MLERIILLSTLGILALLVGTVLAWRLLSQRHALPCPTWLIWTLEHRIMERAAGSQILLDRAGVMPGMEVLDAGCGPGRLTVPLAERVGAKGRVLAMDIQRVMLDLLEQRVADSGLANVEVLHAGLGEGLLGADRFDRFFLVTVLGEIPNRSEALREIKHALRPSGILSITEVFPDPHFQRQRVVRQLASEVGLIQGKVFGNARAYTLNLLKSEEARVFDYTQAASGRPERSGPGAEEQQGLSHRIGTKKVYL